jgi:hypothetical protein
MEPLSEALRLLRRQSELADAMRLPSDIPIEAQALRNLTRKMRESLLADEPIANARLRE